MRALFAHYPTSRSYIDTYRSYIYTPIIPGALLTLYAALRLVFLQSFISDALRPIRTTYTMLLEATFPHTAKIMRDSDSVSD